MLINHSHTNNKDRELRKDKKHKQRNSRNEMLSNKQSSFIIYVCIFYFFWSNIYVYIRSSSYRIMQPPVSLMKQRTIKFRFFFFF